MTNNDKLNAMSVEEKAKYIVDIHVIWLTEIKENDLSLLEFWKLWLATESEE